MKEIEAKFRLHDAERLRRALAANAFVCAGRVRETNVLFDRADSSLRSQGSTLRLRTNLPIGQNESELPSGERDGNPRHVLTFKGPVEPGRVKIRSEFETDIADAGNFQLILEQLGFVPTLIFEKRRETWQNNECEVVIDELPALGWFAEVEGPSVAVVEETTYLLGIPASDAEVRSYAAMIANLPQSATDSRPRRLTF